MIIALESKKLKKTGFIAAFLGGGILAAMIPIMNMAFRSEMYVGLGGSPLSILFDANWQMISMLNVLLVISGACIMYHTEFADNAIQKMRTLPLKESRMFLGKAILLSGMCIIILAIEAAGLGFCSLHWFTGHGELAVDMLQNFGYMLVMILPTVVFSLLIASACKNMWVSLGTGVICVFIATMLPMDNFVCSLFPFARPFHTFEAASAERAVQYICAAAAEIVVGAGAELVFLKVRRSFE